MPAAARSAQGHDKVQTCYSHQGNNDTRIFGEKDFKVWRQITVIASQDLL